MANWYMTSFKTKDKDIAEVIKNGRTIDFYYDEATGRGHCCLAWGLCSFNMEQVEKIAKNNTSSFYILSQDSLANVEQEWEFKNGKEVLSEIRHDIFDWIDDGDTVHVVRKRDLPPLDNTRLMCYTIPRN